MSAEKKKAPRKAAPAKKTVRKKPKNEKHIIGFLFLICLLINVFLGTLMLGFKSLGIPDLRRVENYRPAQASIIYDRHGQVVKRIFKENRTVVSLAQMHDLLPKAFVAAEDGRFYEHPGLDFISVLRAAINNAREGRRGQGGSTITQQVAKSLLLTPEKTYIRKFKEAILAWRIDQLLTKEEILFIYLNEIYLGAGAYGVEAAAQVYFGKHASDLSLAEVAILAGLPQAPSRYSPITHLDRALARQKYVLNRMAADGYVSQEIAQKAYNTRPKIRKSNASFSAVNGYYLDVVTKRAERILDEPLKEAGASIYTYLDQNIQAKGVKAVKRGTSAVMARSGAGTETPQGAIVCIEKGNGRVRALVGGTDYRTTPFNRSVQAKRPAGSTFKPFVYAAALEKGWSPDSTISDAPLTISGGRRGVWRPQNYSGKYHGDTTLTTALSHSYNVASVRLMRKVGVKDVHKVAKGAGISSKLTPDLSLALGAVDVSPFEMTAAYGSFVDKGIYTVPRLISTIKQEGYTVYSAKKEQQRVLKSHTANLMKSMLVAVVEEGTGKRAQKVPGTSGGKTGTSNDNRDAWFIGFNGDLIAGVWVGYDKNKSLGGYENGSRTALPIWCDFISSVNN